MLGKIISEIIEVIKYAILVRLFANLFIQGPKPRWFEILEQYTDPILNPFRSLIPPIMLGGAYLDLSPIILFFVLGLVQNFVRWIL